MNFEFSAEQERFRQEVGAFLDAELPPNWAGYVGGTTGDHVSDGSDGWQVFIEHMYLVSFGATIAAGTSEIQKNIIALRGLGLPKG